MQSLLQNMKLFEYDVYNPWGSFETPIILHNSLAELRKEPVVQPWKHTATWTRVPASLTVAI